MARELWSTKVILPPPYRSSNRAMTGIRVTFIVLCASLALLPLVGMIWAPTNETTENRELAEFPSAISESGVNVDFLSDLGGYFEDHFAYKSMFATTQASLSAQFQASANPEAVVLGEDGWLYYVGTLNDYHGIGLLGQHEVDNLAFDMSLIRDYCSLYGATFAVTIAPNKNHLYPEHMPYYMGEPAENNVLQMLASSMKDNHVPYFDAYEEFSSHDEVYYYQRDSHWNTDGARLASVGILKCLGKTDSADRIAGLTPVWEDGYISDLDVMLSPDDLHTEQDANFDKQLRWWYEEGEIPEDLYIKTRGDPRQSNGTLFMFRDSFGNKMLQFLADSFETAYFSKNSPCDMTLVSELGATDVVYECVERNLRQILDEPAIMPAPLTSIDSEEINRGAIDGLEGWDQISIIEDEKFGMIEGCIPSKYRDENTTDIYIGLEKNGSTNWYVPFRVTFDGSEYCYRAYIDKEMLNDAETVSVVVNNKGSLKLVQTTG